MMLAKVAACVIGLVATVGQYETLEHEIIRVREVWNATYSDLTDGQEQAAEGWAGESEERQRILATVVIETRNLDGAFKQLKLGGSKQVSNVLSAIVNYCAAAAKLTAADGAFTSVAFIMELSDTRAMAEYFGGHISDPAIVKRCSL